MAVLLKYKINLHITQACNYQCRYCFADFGERKDLPLESWKRIIDSIAKSGIIDKITFAGGEPMLYKDFMPLVEYAFSKGFGLSIITNGSLLVRPNAFPLKQIFKKMEFLGISVDSFSENTLSSLGCCQKNDETLSFNKLETIIREAKEANPPIKIKVNTVVTSLNAGEDLSCLKELPIDRWKVLKMKPFKSNEHDNQDLTIPQEKFEAFVQRHKDAGMNPVVEESMVRSYITVDNQGRLLDNSGLSYEIVGNLLEEEFLDVFSRYKIDDKLYIKRY